MKTVSQVLAQKDKNIFSVHGDISVLAGLQVMVEKNISALLVMENDLLKGIFTERDYARKIVLQGRSSKDTLISEVMTSKLILVDMQDSIDDCMQLMTVNHIRHLPVVEGDKVLGMISIGDAVKSVIDNQRSIIAHLEGYINGYSIS